MPPSGFTKQQTTGLDDFLAECFGALSEEAKEKNLPFRAAVHAEIGNIERDLATNKRSTVATSVLRLVQAFYMKLHEELTDDEDEDSFSSVAYDVLEKLIAEVEAIKVDEKELAPA